MKSWKTIDAVVLAILLGLIAAIIAEGSQLYRIRQINLAIARPEAIVVEDDSPPEIVFAKAWHLGHRGEFQEALRLYNGIEHRVTRGEYEKVKYNMGQLYLSEAARYWNEQGVWAYSEVLTWSALAQKAFHDVLVLNPSNWDARFNLEFALRISPPPRAQEKADWTGRRSSVHSIYPGIPGGGP
ncbi:MAG: MxaK protein [Methylococcaceae bacterium]|nr:MxaK protein [Methylococcaceae bacterium]